MPLELNADEPSEITRQEYDDVLAAILANVASAHDRPLSDLTDEQVRALTKLAYHEPIETSRLEDKVRNAIRARGDGEPKAMKFNLNVFKADAKLQRKRFEEDKARKIAIAKRNGKVEDGAKLDPDLEQALKAPERDTQEKLFSNSSYLRAVGMLELERKGRVWWDDFHNNLMTDWDGSKSDAVVPQRKVTDGFVLAVYAWLQGLDHKLATGLSEGTTRQALRHFANQDVRNEAKDWLKSLKWDENPRLSSWLNNAFGVEDDEYHQAVGRCWFVSMAARMMCPGVKVDTMPVLFGAQGTKKSTALEVIGGKWYATINISADKQQDFLMSLQGLVVAEIAELDAIRGTATTRVKTLLSTATDHFRIPYGHGIEQFKRTAVLCGSTNEKNWHRDETGGRRFWPIKIATEIDLKWLAENREQLFAEALHRYQAGEKWWDVPEDEQHRRVMDHFTADPWEERIASWIASNDLWTGAEGQDVERIFPDDTATEGSKYYGTLITTNRVLSECLQIPVERQPGRPSSKVVTIMHSLGFEMKVVRDVQKGSRRTKRAWVVTSNTETANDQLSMPLKQIEGK
jgi:predicted P-loop ATPase